ncbi:MAG: RNA polymerase sigma factor [Candidatus Magasanikbacteria bacterium]|jgi:RNA polymerase sigma-70 factor, ECF subfamily|nr:RNA polymerase sigma factor [Candidatus Magasanikbacteria bacterium]MBT4315025.1 RNA polymerase sigma factor [Candidatus Magasanikbacteria bacterium]MBT4546804.1 RNA polymerase sigma factor [Candidatus Magasanikbacteria bacterium]MBT6818969.1 RNA polymerase sigma factor [Candidatus Magasanikbacteria bacterium]
MAQIVKCEGKNDIELVQLALKNPDYFVCIMKNYEDKLIRFIRRISGANIQDAEDVLQEVFIKVYKNLNSYDNNLKFSSWIYRITRNYVISEFRKKKSRGEAFLVDEEWGTFVSELNIEKELDKKINREVLLKVIDNIDIKYREVLILKFLEERDYKEISDILKKPAGTVGTLINRAKKKLRQEIEKQNIKL